MTLWWLNPPTGKFTQFKLIKMSHVEPEKLETFVFSSVVNWAVIQLCPSGTNQWPRAGGQTPSSPSYENSLHSLVSSLSTVSVHFLSEKSPTRFWSDITGRFLSDKQYADKSGGGGITKLNNARPLGLAICPPLRGPGQGRQLRDGFS